MNFREYIQQLLIETQVDLFEDDRFISKDGNFYIDVDSLTPKELTQIVNKLQALTYDVKSVSDFKKLMTKNVYVVGDKEVKFYKVHNDDWISVINQVLKLTKTPKKLDKNLLDEVLKNIKAVKDGDVSIGQFITRTTGYILPDGKVIDLGGGYSRANDHRIIGSYFDHNIDSQTDAMDHFLKNTGSIRYMPEGPGLDIVTLPTRLQMVQLENVMKKAHDELAVDLRSDNYRRVSKIYNKDTNPKILVRDIETYYKSGKIRDTSAFEQFVIIHTLI